ncbi:MAG: M16 family metallopeptidase [Candidatus Binataceae bacterium]
MAERADSPLTELRFVCDGGFGVDAPTQSGRAELAMAMFSDAALLNGAKLDARLTLLGATISGRVAADGAIVAMSALACNLPSALTLYAQSLANPHFDMRTFARVRAARIELISRELLSPFNLASRLLAQMLFPANHQYGPSYITGGGARTTTTLTQEDIRRYFAEHLSPGRGTLIVAGGSACTEMRPLLENGFRRWRKSSSRIDSNATTSKQHAAPLAVNENPELMLVDFPRAKQCGLFLGLRIPRQESSLALMVVDAISAGMFTSRLNLSLRENKGWTYGAQSWRSRTRDGGLWIICCSVRPDRTIESMGKIHQELQGLASCAPCTDEELSRAINYLVGRNYSHYETCAETADALAEGLLLGQPSDYVWTFEERLRQIDAIQVTAACKRMLAADALRWVVVGNAAELKMRLLKAGYQHIQIVNAECLST